MSRSVAPWYSCKYQTDSWFGDYPMRAPCLVFVLLLIPAGCAARDQRAFNHTWLAVEERVAGGWARRSAYPLKGVSPQGILMINDVGCTAEFVGSSAYGDVYVVGGHTSAGQVPANAVLFRGEALLVFETADRRIYIIPTSAN